LGEGIVAESDELLEDFKYMEKGYIFTEKGQELADEYKDMPPEQAMSAFLLGLR
jgi:hypothetical protein